MTAKKVPETAPEAAPAPEAPPPVPVDLTPQEDAIFGQYALYLKAQQEFIASVPYPNLPQLREYPIDGLRELLRWHGSWVANLLSRESEVEAHVYALKEVKGRLFNLQASQVGKKTEWETLAAVSGASPRFQEVSGYLTQEQMLLITCKGRREAHQAAYNELSRQIAIWEKEMELAARR